MPREMDDLELEKKKTIVSVGISVCFTVKFVVFISHGNKLPQIWWLKTIKMYSLRVLDGEV